MLQKPFYALNCPIIPDDDNGPMQLPPAFMVSARSQQEVAAALSTWQQQFNVSVVQTRSFSKSYVNERCRKYSWKSRLFAVYQFIFKRLLSLHPEESHFVIIEDDVVLKDGVNLRRELVWAINHDIDFYSFQPTKSKSCVYHYGTNALIVSRKVMHQIIDADVDTFCRLPVDMAIARAGPWHVTRKPLTQHIGKRLNFKDTAEPITRAKKLISR
jgi:hypothetical protein